MTFSNLINSAESSAMVYGAYQSKDGALLSRQFETPVKFESLGNCLTIKILIPDNNGISKPHNIFGTVRRSEDEEDNRLGKVNEAEEVEKDYRFYGYSSEFGVIEGNIVVSNNRSRDTEAYLSFYSAGPGSFETKDLDTQITFQTRADNRYLPSFKINSIQ